MKEGRSVGRTVSDGQKSHNFYDFAQVSLPHPVDNYNEQKSIQYISNVSTVNHRVLWAKLKIIYPTHFFEILNFLQLQILMHYHLVIYISWTELTNTNIKLH